MLQIDTLTLGLYQVNCYVIRQEGSANCVVIDPGYEPQSIMRFLEENGLQLGGVLLTHGHFDHVGAAEALVAQTGCTLWMSKADLSFPQDALHLQFFPLTNWASTSVRFCDDGDVVTAAGLSFTVLKTPGHTPGSVCYRCGEFLFTGDTLFAGACGRTDLPAGNWAEMQASLARLKAIAEDLRIFPGHGTPSTLNLERRNNPYLL